VQGAAGGAALTAEALLTAAWSPHGAIPTPFHTLLEDSRSTSYSYFIVENLGGWKQKHPNRWLWELKTRIQPASRIEKMHRSR
jgi:hypothetical protein